MGDLNNKLKVLETKRLRLRRITSDDLNDMFEYGSNEDVSEFVSWNTHQSISDTKNFLDFVLKQYEEEKNLFWGIEYKNEKKLIGTIDFVSLSTKHKIGEIGYVLSKEYWGKGIMTEAAGEVINYGFNELELVRIQARCFTENIGSEKVMIKTGMTYEGTIRKGMYIKGRHQDLKMYSILKDEF
ncbi:GNAT family N-acetyltransferase [Bacillus salitolerans]|uniref:GNAT family N-acetyltransferase n=1 Tax=Bacillus salitolerans TaxID=1437434 RepID=A0ABW4LU22_9BACI